MATMAANPSPSAPSRALKLQSLTCVDMRTLSQSELHSLSRSSSSVFDLRSTHELLPPKIDRSLFNESAGSRRQTYSRPNKPQSTSPSSTGHRRRVAGLLPTPKLPPSQDDDPDNKENRRIIDYLKEFIRRDPKFDQVELHPPPALTVADGGLEAKMVDGNQKLELGFVKFGGDRKRKRGRKPKVKVLLEEPKGGMDIVNKKGVPADLTSLANMEEPFAEEIRKRSLGLQTEAELLGFLRDLNGQWGSRRKKRRIVDAGEFGDVFPVGWKLLLGLKRKEGRAWIYCRRYISPTGQQFVTCKDAALYLQSLFTNNNAECSAGQMNNSIQDDSRDNHESEHADPEHDDDQKQKQIVLSGSTEPYSSMTNERVKEIALLGIEHLAEVQIHDLFECHKCSMTFEDKDSYLQHLLSFHQKTTRRYRLGSSVGEGVIIKDGKYECQFCHKVFLERRRYNGHVGIHVRNYVRKVEESPGQTLQRKVTSPTSDDLPSRISKMDALIEIAQNSILEDTMMELDDKINSGISPDKASVVFTSEGAFATVEQNKKSDSPAGEQQMENSIAARNMEEYIKSKHAECMASNSNLDKIDDNMKIADAKVELEGDCQGRLLAPSGIQINYDKQSASSGCTNTTEQLTLDEVNDISDKIGNDISANGYVLEAVDQASEENVFQPGVSDSSMSFGQSLNSFPTFDGISDKGGKQFYGVDQKQNSGNGFDELKLYDIESLKYGLATGQDSLIGLANDVEMEGGYSSSVQLESQDANVLKVASEHQLLTVCVWCGIEFNHDSGSSEIQPDSVGYMCPACKTKISGQINVLDTGSPLNSEHI